MTIKNDVVLWDDGKDKLRLFSVSIDQQYMYINELPCITFGISFENAYYKGYDIFTLFDLFYSETIKKIEKTYRSLNGTFRIKDDGADTDGYIDFEMINGRLYIKGQLGASFTSHSLKFEFKADQTLIGELLKSITV
ncbi:MAG: hypothetical protein E7480_01285 [Ruminococcaceae bacterium]|nr:hypothetical protein [Oscillospiraceae bacterium]